MNSTTTLYVLTISYRKDSTFERWFPYKPALSEIKEAIQNLNSDVNWIALDKREVEIKKTTLLGITDEIEKLVM